MPYISSSVLWWVEHYDSLLQEQYFARKFALPLNCEWLKPVVKW